ncbi:hypothetical protein EVAR_63303_1 [Eumeta japonica]|uniref:Uncharacterized protein n=1 Tax=Eumeta variegata TaxID=151549 RepID=A0A4C1Z8D9_EUMVA|nr:hypothetical protein EVAR_63303_1 [Eumeta japonica]
MSRAFSTLACHPAVFGEAIIEVQLYSIADQIIPTSGGKFLVSFNPTRPACVGTRYGVSLLGDAADIHKVCVLQKRAVSAIYKTPAFMYLLKGYPSTIFLFQIAGLRPRVLRAGGVVDDLGPPRGDSVRDRRLNVLSKSWSARF